MWIDSHCHPFASAFDADRDAILARAREAGVSGMLVVGFTQVANRQVLDFVSGREGMWAAIGVHPCDTVDWTDFEEAFIREQAKAGRIVAVGEMGLDYHHMTASQEEQERVFRAQIRLAKELNLPVIVHSRDAAEDTLHILLDEEAKKVVFHCYTYDYEFGKRVWDAGFYTSFSGVLTYPSGRAIAEACCQGPLDQFLIETDCPYLAPQSARGQRNEMAFVSEVGEKMAELKGISEESLARQLEENFRRLFLRL